MAGGWAGWLGLAGWLGWLAGLGWRPMWVAGVGWVGGGGWVAGWSGGVGCAGYGFLGLVVWLVRVLGYLGLLYPYMFIYDVSHPLPHNYAALYIGKTHI